MNDFIPLGSLFNLAGPDLIIILLLVVPLAFVIWMLIDCVKYESEVGNIKLIWALIILLLPLGSIVYFFARKCGRIGGIRRRSPHMKFSQKQIEKWSRLRKEGKTHYAITRGLFGLGAPSIIGFVMIELWMDPNQNIYSLLGSLLVMIPGCLYGGYRFGRRQWDTFEKQYASSRPLESAPIPEAVIPQQDVSCDLSHNRPTVPPPEIKLGPSTPPPLPAAHRHLLNIVARIGIIGALAVLCVLFCALCVFCLGVLLDQHSTVEHASVDTPAPVSQGTPDPLDAAITRAARESAEAVEAKQEHDAEKVRAEEWKAQQARVTDQTKRAQAIDVAEVKRVAALKEADFAAWKAKRKAGMQQTAANLRPEQVQAWNQAMAVWNKLSPAQREALYRREYEQRAARLTSGADMSEPSISDADWERALPPR